MAGILQIVGTPIGNLEDFSPRAARVLSQATLILAEDTRKARFIFESFGISLNAKKILSCNAHNEKGRINGVLESLAADNNAVLMTDSGAPCVSDPGGLMVQAVVQAGFKVEVIPGPSAPIAALMGAGLIANRFAFLGFLPLKGLERERIVRSAAQAGLALVIFESANRIEKTLADLHAWCGQRNVVVARELTKKFETFHRGQLGGTFAPELVLKGEMVIVVEAASHKIAHEANDLYALIEEELQANAHYFDLPVKEVAQSIAHKLGSTKSVIYPLVLKAKILLTN